LELLFPFAFAILVAFIASSKGRNPVGWFFIGLFANCIGLILVLVLPDENQRRNLESENRRLREKVRMDRTTADRRHRETEKRLSVHDVALGVDTSEEAKRIGERERDEAEGRPDLKPNHRFYSVNWHYSDGDDQNGPVGFDELKSLWTDGTIGAASLVWNKHLSDWKTVDSVRNLEDELRA
jgi:hypothetical protein